MAQNCRFRPARAVVVAGLTCLFSVAATSTIRAAGVWRSDYQRAKAEALRDNKLLLLHFHASWCGPCRQMERDVLSSPQLGRYLGADVIAVKIDSDRHPELTRRLNVQSLPSDIFVTPQGKVVHRVAGSQSAGNYFNMVSRVSAKFTRTRRTVADKQPAPQTEPKLKQRPEPAGDVLAKVDESYHPSDEDDASTRAQEPLVDVSLDGFCPVTLWSSREWKRGRAEYAMSYKGQKYFMSSSAELAQFRKEPSRYAPRLLGCDPVVLSEVDQAVPGSTSFGAFYDGELYLFRSSETRARFKQDPRRFSRTRHVLREEIRRRRS